MAEYAMPQNSIRYCIATYLTMLKVPGLYFTILYDVTLYYYCTLLYYTVTVLK